MTYIEAIIFGIVQGLTEFLPISSTAHIIITEMILGYSFPGLSFEIFLHLASIIAIIAYFRWTLIEVIVGFFAYFKRKSMENRVHFYFGLYLLTATAITGGLGLFLNNLAFDVMKTPSFIAAALVITGIFLIIIERFHTYGMRTERSMNFLDAIVVGLVQTLAVLPGISRSGSTLVAGLFMGLSRDTAVRYSFLLAIPVILGSSVLALDDLSASLWVDIGGGPLLVSFFTTLIFSWVGIVWLIDFLRKSKLIYFAIYCFILAILVFTLIDPTAIMEV